MSPDETPTTNDSLYREIPRAEWARMAAGMEQPLTETEVVQLRGIGDRLDITEVREVYLPLSRLLSLYASATKGYQAGGFNSLEVASVYRPQTVRSYEAGVKSWFPDYRLLLNASLYYYRYSNLPNLTLVSNGGGSGNDLPQYQIIPSDQEAKGLELEARWQATDNLRFNAAAAYINQTYRKYTTSAGLDLSGEATGQPLWSGTAGVDYVLRDVARGDLDFTLQGAYTGRARCNADSPLQGTCIPNLPFKTGASRTRADIRVGWSSPATPWSVAVFVNNVFDKQYVTGLNNISTTVLGTTSAGISAPRMWGVELAVKL